MKRIMGFAVLLVLLLSACVPLGDNEKPPASESEQPKTEQPPAVQEEKGAGLAVHYIDVGQGSSAYLEWDGYSMLIDAGIDNLHC